MSTPAQAKARWDRMSPTEKEARRSQQRERNLRIKYGLTPEDYARLWVAQGEACGACGSTEPRGGPKRSEWAIDHDHETGEVRGILCFSCNVALGHVGDSVDRLFDLANYLRGRDGATRH